MDVIKGVITAAETIRLEPHMGYIAQTQHVAEINFVHLSTSLFFVLTREIHSKFRLYRLKLLTATILGALNFTTQKTR